ncbi:MAG: hypothetical protein ACE5DW_03295 [Thermodesulfobacteriota bacterium]
MKKAKGPSRERVGLRFAVHSLLLSSEGFFLCSPGEGELAGLQHWVYAWYAGGV